ncbi:MAG: DeoR/GlpR family DNA-binding transcription regulator [Limisphaerales bacterium]|jgi:DeoR/GlpR family transcriptional regulator of sugar metabolism
MQAEERQKRIADHLQQAEFSSLDELSELVDASISTVRRDLTLLEATGLLKRTHGGARLVQPQSEEFIFTERDNRENDAKESIGRACARLIPPNQSVIIDAGSTAYHASKHLGGGGPQIITNSLPVANQYASSGNVEVILSGGVIYPRLGVLVGPIAKETFSRMHADFAIMGSGGITEEGVTNSHNLLIDIQKEMLRAARKVIFCLDHTKFGRRSVSFLCELNQIDYIITDTKAPPAMLELLSARGIEVMLAE